MEKEETEGRVKKILKRWAQNLGLFFGSIFIFLFLLEVGIRVFYPQSILVLKGLFKSDPVLNAKLVPNFFGRERNVEYSTIVRINSLGIRDKEYPKEDKADFRILVLGDSFTFGIGVNLEDTYPKVLEQMLKKEYPGKKYEVINCGVPGVGTDYEYLLLKEIGNRFKPDVVLTGFFTGNDVSDTMYGYDRYEVKDGLLYWKKEAREKLGDLPWVKKNSEAFANEINRASKVKALTDQQKSRIRRFIDKVLENLETSINELKRFLRSNSHAYLFLWHRYNLVRERLFEREVPPSNRKSKSVNLLNLFWYETYLLKEYSEEIEEGWKLTKGYLKKIDELAKSWGGKSMIVVIPIPDQVYPELFWKKKRRFEIDSSLFDFEKPQKILKEFGSQNGIPVCDLLPVFKEEGRKEKLYYRYNIHWNKNGHRLAGKLIYEKLRGEKMLPQGSEVTE